MSTNESIQRAKHDLERHRDDIERILGSNYQANERYRQLVEEVSNGRSVVYAILDLRGL